MTPTDDVLTPAAFWLALLIIAAVLAALATLRADTKIRKASARLDSMVADFQAAEAACEHTWRPYANYRLCLDCGQRENQP